MSKYNKLVTLILCVVLGYLGVHHFYVKKNKMGLLYLCTLGLLGVGWIVDIILICTDKYKDSDGEYVTTPSISNKTRNGVIIGFAAVLGISACFSLTNSNDNDTEIAENTETNALITENSVETYNEDYIDVNAELDKMTNDSEVKNIEETIDNISETTSESLELSTGITQEITEAIPVDELSETYITTDIYSEIPDSSENSNNTEAHFDTYDIPEQQNTIEYVLNTSTNKFHRPNCSSVKKIKPENYSTTDSRENAINSGYTPCGNCNP